MMLRHPFFYTAEHKSPMELEIEADACAVAEQLLSGARPRTQFTGQEIDKLVSGLTLVIAEESAEQGLRATKILESLATHESLSAHERGMARGAGERVKKEQASALSEEDVDHVLAPR